MNGHLPDAADRLAAATIDICSRLRSAVDERKRDEAEIVLWERVLGVTTAKHALTGARFGELLRAMQVAAREAIAEAQPDLVKEFAHWEKTLAIHVDPDDTLQRRFDRIMDRREERFEERLMSERRPGNDMLGAIGRRERALDLAADASLTVGQRLDRLLGAAKTFAGPELPAVDDDEIPF